MHKTFIKIFAILIIPVFLFACKEEHAEGVDPDVLNEVLAQALGTSNELDTMLLKAYGTASLGHNMAVADPDAAMVKLEDALALARQARSAKYRSAYKSLNAKTADWPKADRDQVAAAIKNIDEASRRVWLIRYIAEGMDMADPARADEVAAFAVNELSTQSPTDSYRDMGFRQMAAYYSDKDLGSAAVLAEKIVDPRIKTFAFRELGKKAMASGDNAAATTLLNAAASFASTIHKMDDEPAVGTYAPSAPESVKDQIRRHENAKQVAYSARKVAEIGVLMRDISAGSSKKHLDEALKDAMSIDKDEFPDTRAYALSDIAAKYAVIDTNKASSIMGEIGAESIAAKISGTVQIAKVKQSVSAANIISDISPLLSQVENEDLEKYEGAAALYAVGKMIAETSPEKAKELAGDIKFPNMMNDLLIEAAVAWAAESIDEARKVVEEVAPPSAGHGGGHGVFFNVYKYAPAMNLYQKASAYKGMADAVKGSDPETAMKLYTKAAGYAAESGSKQMQWSLAVEMCKIDHTKFMGYASKLEPADPKSHTMALMDIASDWSMAGDPYAGLVWDEATKVAGSSVDDFEAGCLLGTVGAACAGSFPDKAGVAFEMAAVRYAKIGVE